jgi:hypothetical protein
MSAIMEQYLREIRKRRVLDINIEANYQHVGFYMKVKHFSALLHPRKKYQKM